MNEGKKEYNFIAIVYHNNNNKTWWDESETREWWTLKCETKVCSLESEDQTKALKFPSGKLNGWVVNSMTAR